MEKKEERRSGKERRSEDQRKTVGCHRDDFLSYFPVYTPREDPFLNPYYKPTACVLLILKESI